MAIPCEACGRPVYEQAVVCPHCGDRTGVPSDPIAEHKVAELHDSRPPPAPLPEIRSAPDPIGAVAHGFELVIALIDGLADDHDDVDDEPLPRAIVHKRPIK